MEIFIENTSGLELAESVCRAAENSERKRCLCSEVSGWHKVAKLESGAQTHLQAKLSSLVR